MYSMPSSYNVFTPTDLMASTSQGSLGFTFEAIYPWMHDFQKKWASARITSTNLVQPLKLMLAHTVIGGLIITCK